ncbi:porin family protein [Vibrio sp. SM6]|uniref:Porin family protein n=1 Tax=Vibrio agarilyticus TaxID=2726741 RepID=A0A7X8TT39_9VIBR|nr:outer membrane beta-barrel protein [Vibrio agarilyticus]NLS14146.1 porin family protein [Vibrio agarilyticus]
MKKTLALSVLLALSTSAIASESTTQDKSGHTLSIGMSKVSGDISNISDDTVFSVSYDYTTNQGVIIGGYFMPELVSSSMSYMDVNLSLDTSVLGMYLGYQFDNNIRLTSGLSFTTVEAKLSDNYASVSDEETNTGFMFGIDYLFSEKVLIGTRFVTHDVAGVEGSSMGISAGYKF